VSVFPLLVIVHALAATVWTGGHLVLDLGVLLRALRERSAGAIRTFEETFEPLGLTALAIQVITGLWMGGIVLPGFQGLFSPANPIGWHIRGITAPGDRVRGGGGADPAGRPGLSRCTSPAVGAQSNQGGRFEGSTELFTSLNATPETAARLIGPKSTKDRQWPRYWTGRRRRSRTS